MTRFLALVFVLALAGACGDGPGPAPEPKRSETGDQGGGAEVTIAARPRLEALRHAGGWRLRLGPPLRPGRPDPPETALIEDEKGEELARAPFDQDGVHFDLRRSGLVRGVLLYADGSRLAAELVLP
ncbi:MAG: hypothetical protein H6807_07935 [Planctomycetes bacterium]|nr:hypothetical protein [Planctomycetota bacterium]